MGGGGGLSVCGKRPIIGVIATFHLATLFMNNEIEFTIDRIKCYNSSVNDNLLKADNVHILIFMIL